MKNKLGIVSCLAVMALPFMALAQIQATNADSVIVSTVQFINARVIPLLIGIAILYFIWGVLTYIRAAGDEEKRKEGRNMMIYGIIAIAVMVSVIGLVNVLSNSVGWGNNTSISGPKINF